jgi:hypothetical protein
MQRRDFFSVMLLGAALSGPAAAQDIVSRIVNQLRGQGFASIIEERTLLGRVRILADRTDGQREIIVNPSTGEILRDLWVPASGDANLVEIIKDGQTSGGTGNSGHGSGDEGDEGDDGEDGEGEGDGEGDDDDDDDDDGE